MKNKTIFIFTDYFLPGCQAGGPVTSIANLVTLLEDEFNFIIVTRNKDLGIEKEYENIQSDILTKYKDFNIIYLSEITSNKINTILNKYNPDLIYLNSFFSVFTRKILFSKYKNKTILAPRGELQKNALAIKKIKKLIYLKVFKFLKLEKDIYFHSTDITETEELKSNFNTENITTISNIPRINSSKALLKNKDELKLIFISRIRDNKNLHFALEILSKSKKEIVFDIYGPIEDKNYWIKCQELIKGLPKNIQASYKGVLSPLDILETMKKYHGLLLPTKTENFGHVIVEAMISGLIPIISNQTPWKELEKEKIGWDIDLDKAKDYLEAIEKLYAMSQEDYKEYSMNNIKYINNKLHVNKIKNTYINMFKSQLNKGEVNYVQR